MKKLTVLLMAIAISSSMVSAVEFARPRMDGIDKQRERIAAILEDADAELSERKRAYLQQRLEILDIQSDFRTALRDAISELGEDATREERSDVVRSVRDTFAERFEEIKDRRRDATTHRRNQRTRDRETDG